MTKHDYDAGKPDGKLGPTTRQAIAAFSQKYGIANEPDSCSIPDDHISPRRSAGAEGISLRGHNAGSKNFS